MSAETEDLKPWRDYEAIYNRPDPSAYFRALEPLGYRQPDVVTGFLQEYGASIAARLDRSRLRILDFGCGYGAFGAVLRHRLAMEDLYARFRAERPARFLEEDQSFFAEHRGSGPDVDLGGIDIAERAVAYAEACGLIDQGFSEDLTERDPGPALKAFFAETDLVLETGAVYQHVSGCYARLLDSSPRRPWFLFGPRGDADTGPLAAILEQQGYRLEVVSSHQRRYRRFSDAEEQADSEANMLALGRRIEEHSKAGWFVNPLILARPEAEAAVVPIEAWRF